MEKLTPQAAVAKCANGPILSRDDVAAYIPSFAFTAGDVRIYALTGDLSAIDRIHTMADLDKEHAGYWIGAGSVQIGRA